ncbi:S-layer homology domain-containing protein [Paenibacillus radicis (ex Xue et al. 2023)]|uniref:S-layer homology domain-containing protein n=1 Tax=Paenibacillus radicis (ex Xue et al. 2023) TaxID=2972489 RepID=A0ABT1YFH5_9BACL|nr:S-layer homology domain-containing protein [Paenibacillus radicis (ex Xue et al. 2023)]MCR8631959.1 S-layer homology domain-containing protein [Paenibacillus radicis (ex Xue et al. 2023)]
MLERVDGAIGRHRPPREAGGPITSSGAYPSYTDCDTNRLLGAWAVDYVNIASSSGLAKGVGEGRFAPGMAATRAQGAVIILRALVKLEMLGK